MTKMKYLQAAIVALFMWFGGPLQISAASTYNNYRLPTALQPDLYNVKLITYLSNSENLTFEGEVSIRFQVLKDTNNITLHVHHLIVDDSRILVKSYADEDLNVCVDGVNTVPELDFYIIQLCQPLHKGQTYEVVLHFAGVLNEKLWGYFRNSYVDRFTNETRWLSVTDFEPLMARFAFPCFDEPNYKAKFRIWLGHHKSLNAISNMPMEKQIPLEGLPDFVWSIFEESLSMSTYLVAFTINDFAFVESRIEGSDVVFRTWSRRDYIDQCEFAAEVGPKLLKYYEELFGIPFPLKKMDFVAMPNYGSGAMENWGMITYKERYLLLSPDNAHARQKTKIAGIIAHELAHQWFGNLVTMKWWTDLWLNEGFATYIASLGKEFLYPSQENYIFDSIMNLRGILDTDAVLGSHPISEPIISSKGIAQHFDSISYIKASIILRMIHSFMGQDGFFEGIRYYLSKHEYQNAEQDNLWAAFTDRARKYNRLEPQYELKTIMDSWTLQSGYPLVNVSRNYETGSVEISQQRFLKNTTMLEGNEGNKCWWIPLSYTTAAEYDFNNTAPKVWLECDAYSHSVHLKLDNVVSAHEWIIYNIQMSGLYRVNYDTENWRLIGNVLKSAKYERIPLMNRLQLISDIIACANSGHHGLPIVFDFLEYLINERDFLPWELAMEDFGAVINPLLQLSTLQDHLRAYVRYIVEPMYTYINELSNSEDPTKMFLKPTINSWACKVELENCLHKAISYFQQWKSAENINEIPSDWRTISFCMGIRHGDLNDWTLMWHRFNNTKDDSFILNALGCTRNETLLKEYLHLIFDQNSQIPLKYSPVAFESIADNEIGRPIALEYIVGNISELYKRGFNIKLLLYHLVGPTMSIEGLNSIHDILNSNKELFKGPDNFVQRLVESIDYKKQWIERNLEEVTAYFWNRRVLHTEDYGDNLI